MQTMRVMSAVECVCISYIACTQLWLHTFQLKSGHFNNGGREGEEGGGGRVG